MKSSTALRKVVADVLENTSRVKQYGKSSPQPWRSIDLGMMNFMSLDLTLLDKVDLPSTYEGEVPVADLIDIGGGSASSDNEEKTSVLHQRATRLGTKARNPELLKGRGTSQQTVDNVLEKLSPGSSKDCSGYWDEETFGHVCDDKVKVSLDTIKAVLNDRGEFKILRIQCLQRPHHSELPGGRPRTINLWPK